MAKKQIKTIKRRKKSSGNNILSILKNKWLALIFVLGVGLIGSYFVFFSSAAPNNCQNDGDIPICDVDMAGCATQTILNTNDVPQGLGKKGCLYYGAVFRAPTKPMKGTVPISRIYNSNATYHDWVTPSQRVAKEKKGYGFKVEQAASFYAWPAETRPGGTVPVYRLTRTNSNGAQAFFTTDGALVNKLLAAGANDKEGWKKDQLTDSDYVAFYAYRPGYQVPGKPNPYDCGKIENYTSERCKDARENLEKAIDEGKIAQTDACPANVTAYINEPFPGRFTQDCQNKWNAYMQDCSKQDNFLSDRCKNERAALEKAEQERKEKERQERERVAQQARANQPKQTAGKDSDSKPAADSSGSNAPGKKPTTNSSMPSGCPELWEVNINNRASLSPECQRAWDLKLVEFTKVIETAAADQARAAAQADGRSPSQSSAAAVKKPVGNRGTCVVVFSEDKSFSKLNVYYFSSREGILPGKSPQRASAIIKQAQCSVEDVVTHISKVATCRSHRTGSLCSYWAISAFTEMHFHSFSWSNTKVEEYKPMLQYGLRQRIY